MRVEWLLVLFVVLLIATLIGLLALANRERNMARKSGEQRNSPQAQIIGRAEQKAHSIASSRVRGWRGAYPLPEHIKRWAGDDAYAFLKQEQRQGSSYEALDSVASEVNALFAHEYLAAFGRKQEGEDTIHTH